MVSGGRFEEGLVPWRGDVFGRSKWTVLLTALRSLYTICLLAACWHIDFPGKCNLLNTFSHEICPPDAILDLFLVAQAGVGHEGLVQAGSEELVARGVLAAEVEEFCVAHARSGWCSSYFVQGV